MGLADSHNNLAYALSEMGKPTEAEAECRAAVTILGKVVDDDPKVLFHREILAIALNKPRRLSPQARPTSRGP